MYGNGQPEQHSSAPPAYQEQSPDTTGLKVDERLQLKELLSRSLNHIIAQEKLEKDSTLPPYVPPPLSDPAPPGPVGTKELDERNQWLVVTLADPACLDCRCEQFIDGWALLDEANVATQQCSGLLQQWLACQPQAPTGSGCRNCTRARPCTCSTCTRPITDWTLQHTVTKSTTTTVDD